MPTKMLSGKRPFTSERLGSNSVGFAKRSVPSARRCRYYHRLIPAAPERFLAFIYALAHDFEEPRYSVLCELGLSEIS
jgi:hypothetical protein